eukprot:758332-Hanusia_phi.AAC.1
MVLFGYKAVLLFLSMRCAMRGGGIESSDDLDKSLSLDDSREALETQLGLHDISGSLSKDEEEDEKGRRRVRGIMKGDNYTKMFGEFRQLTNIDFRDQYYKFYTRARMDRLKVAKVVPGTFDYALCMRLWAASYFGLEDELLDAIKKGAVVDMVDARKRNRFCRWTALHWAAHSGEREEKEGKDLGWEGGEAGRRGGGEEWEDQRKEGESLILGTEAKCINILIRCGARPDVVDARSRTPMYIAAELGHLEVVRMLLHFFADFSLKDMNGLNAMQ